jgi:uncharacterized protein
MGDSRERRLGRRQTQVNGHDQPRGAILTVPILPSANTVLFPKIYLPLDVHEVRNRRMIRDALAGDHFIGMAMLRETRQGRDYGQAKIYSLGCVGEISSAAALAHGCYHVVLYGLKEFEIQEELAEPSSYRRARVLLRNDAAPDPEILSSARRQEILALIDRASGDKPWEFVERLKDPDVDGETWINLCCFSLPVSGLEKLSLLAAETLQQRVGCLIDVLHFRAFEKGSPLERLYRVKPRDLSN